MREVERTVSDGRETATGTVQVEVLERGSVQPPVTQADHVTIPTGQEATFHPLENDEDPLGGQLRLAHVGTAEGVEVSYSTSAGTARLASGAPGTYYLRTQRASGTLAAYFLQVKYLNDLGSDVEPNDVGAQAMPAPGSDVVIYGDHQIGADVDYYAVTLPAGKSIRAEVIEGDTLETCESNGIDSYLTLYNSIGTSLVTDDDDGRGLCSAIDGTGATPRDSAAHDLATGTYYLKVIRSPAYTTPGDLFNYRLAVTIR
jgi:hypothetical protein